MVIVYLAIAILAAIGAADYCARHRQQAAAVWVIAILVLGDFFIAPFPVVPIECPAIYQTLRDRPERGAVAELPLGMADGFGAITPMDNRILVCQTVHERPLVGGFVARLSPHVLAAYRRDPLLAAWLRMSGDVSGEVPRDLLTPAERLKADGIDFIVLNRTRSSAAMRDYVGSLPLTWLAEDEHYVLYVRK
jgi:hypothetical protein